MTTSGESICAACSKPIEKGNCPCGAVRSWPLNDQEMHAALNPPLPLGERHLEAHWEIAVARTERRVCEGMKSRYPISTDDARIGGAWICGCGFPLMEGTDVHLVEGEPCSCDRSAGDACSNCVEPTS